MWWTKPEDRLPKRICPLLSTRVHGCPRVSTCVRSDAVFGGESQEDGSTTSFLDPTPTMDFLRRTVGVVVGFYPSCRTP